MSIYSYEAVFGARDKTSRPMRRAIRQWFDLYYRDTPSQTHDPSQRIACTVVSKLVKSVFGEYAFSADDPFVRSVGEALSQVRSQAVQLALVGGECYLKPCPDPAGLHFTLIPRNNVLIFARDAAGNPTDLGTLERSSWDGCHYTLAERRRVDSRGFLTLENRLYRSLSPDTLGEAVPLNTHPRYAALSPCYRYSVPLGLGLVRMKTPMLNCVDGSADGVSVYAPAVGLIEHIDRNEWLLSQEFEHGQSRLLVSQDLLRDGLLQDSLFVGLDEDAQQVGMTVFAPQLREQSFLARKQACLRSLESMIGLKRGMLCEVNEDQRTATEITSSAGEYSLTVMDFQNMWAQAVQQAVVLCAALGSLYGLGTPESLAYRLDWGNGVLYDEEKTWQDYLTMVQQGLLRPEYALGWRFGMPTDTPQQRTAIREKFLPENHPAD